MSQSMSFEKFTEDKKAAANEEGTVEPCPWCNRRRVQRSDYIRCIPCGTNWMDGEDRSKDPRIERKVKMLAGMKTAAKEEGS